MTNQQILDLADSLVVERFNNPKNDRTLVGYWKSGFLDGYRQALGLPIDESKKSLKESHKYNDSISLYDNLYNCNPKEMPSDNFLADLLDFAETYDRDYNKKIDELIDMNCGEWFDYVIEYSPKVKQ